MLLCTFSSIPFLFSRTARRAKEYMRWLFDQLAGPVYVEGLTRIRAWFFAIGFILPFHSCTVSLLKEFCDCLALLCMLCQHATTDIALSSIIDEAGKTGMIARWWRRVS